MVEAGRLRSWRSTASTAPGVEAEVMVIPAKREEGRPLMDAPELQLDEVAIKPIPRSRSDTFR